MLARVEEPWGLMEDRHVELERWGIYEEYRQVHAAYVALLRDPAQRMEALKRALFLSWYDYTEPCCYTGVLDLPRVATRRVLEHLEEHLRVGSPDAELAFMLPWYNEFADYIFSQYPDLEHTHRSLATAEPDAWRNAQAVQFVGRGQMGRYWISILEAI